MSLSDRFKSMINKNKETSSSINKENVDPTPLPVPETTPPPAETPNIEQLSKAVAEEQQETEGKQQALDKELHSTRADLEKMDISAKSARDGHNETLQFLQQDAEQEIKFFERKLHEDMTHWDKQLREREKALEQSMRLGEAEALEKKATYAETEGLKRDTAEHAEATLKQQEAKLLEERQKWRDLLRSKENELLTLKQDLARRETDLQNEIKQQDAQRKAAQELWRTRLAELERQSTEKRRAWEEAVKAKEEERTRVQTSFQEKQATWQLEQERHIQEMTRRQERAQEKLSTLKTHLVKETQNWQQVSQSRDEQIQQLKVKLLLSESEGKGQLDQSQKTYQESVSSISQQIQGLQRQLQQEQESCQKQLDVKDKEIQYLKDEIQSKLRHIQDDFAQRMESLNQQKESLNTELQTLQTEYQEAQSRYTTHTAKLKTEQEILEAAHTKRLAEHKLRSDTDISALQTQVASLEKQRDDAEKDLETIRLRWQQELVTKELALKEAQNGVAPQEAEIRKRFATEEEAVTRQVETLKTRLRAVERDRTRTQENIDKMEKEQTIVAQTLERDHRAQEEAMRARSADQVARL